MASGGGAVGSGGCALLRRFLVHHLAEFHARGVELLHRGFDRRFLVALELALEIRERALDLAAHFGADLAAVLLQTLASLDENRLAAVLEVDHLAAGLVFRRVRLGVSLHLLDLVLGEAAGVRDLDIGLLAAGLVGGDHRQNAVGVESEFDFDLRNSSRRRRNAGEIEVAERAVVLRELALALQNMNRHARLIVRGGGEGFLLARRDRRVALDEPRHHAAESLDTQRKRGDVEQQNVLDRAREHAALDRGTDGDHFIRVDALVGLFAEDFLGDLLRLGHAGASADKNDFIDLAGVELRILERAQARTLEPVEKIGAERFELGAIHRHLQVFRPVLIRRDERQIDRCFLHGGELDLGFFRGLLEALKSHRVLADVDAFFLAELLGEEVDDALVPVVAAQMGVAVGAQHFEHTVADIEHRDVERTAAQIEDRDLLVLLAFVESVRECRGGWFVDDAIDFQARDLAGVLGRLALRIVEIGGHGDDRAVNFFAQVVFRGFLQILKNERADLLGRELALIHLDLDKVVGSSDERVGNLRFFVARFSVRRIRAARNFGAPATHESLDREDRVLGVGHLLVLGGLADETLAFFRERNNRGGDPVARAIDQDFRLRAFHDGDARVRGAEVDSDDFGHRDSFLSQTLTSFGRATGVPSPVLLPNQNEKRMKGGSRAQLPDLQPGRRPSTRLPAILTPSNRGKPVERIGGTTRWRSGHFPRQSGAPVLRHDRSMCPRRARISSPSFSGRCTRWAACRSFPHAG